MPSSRADVVDGGYRLSGRWNFSSGIPHATWVAALTPVYQPGREEPSGMRTFLIPKDQVKMVDVWQVGGLRGTGSLSFEADGVLVPASRSYPDNATSSERGPIYVIPTTLLFCSGFATVALGAARAGLDAAIALTKSKTQHFQRERMSDLATTQRMVGQAEARWNAARSYLGEAALSMWAGAKANLSLTMEERIAVRLSSTHAIREAAKVVDTAYALCGSSAIFASGPILRRFQDVHTITQQVQGRLSHYDTAGQYYLDTEPEGIF
jgi:alkylation response protein AidB-like acyl-CoA dehydrogenase